VKGAWEYDSDRVVHVLARALGHHAKVKRYGSKFSWEVWRCSGSHGLTSIARGETRTAALSKRVAEAVIEEVAGR
jgi:hypothetical protein